jgi:hypothetical protein
VVFRTLAEIGELFEPETERMLVSGALVVREGNHYRIVSGAESPDELEASARRQQGRCDCGAIRPGAGPGVR